MTDPSTDPVITFTQDPNMALNLDLNTQEILLAASTHNIPLLRRLIRENQTLGNPANVKDPETGFSPLHAAIAACEEEEENNDAEKQTNGVDTNADGDSSGVVETVKFLLGEGAIWNDLDLNDETPGCIARRLGLMEVYEMIVDAGVRAELLLGRLEEGWEALGDDDDEVDEDEEEQQEGEGAEEATTAVEAATAEPTTEEQPAATEDPSVTQPRYLDSNLTFTNDRLLDSDQNGVMMSWESTIMEKSAAKLLPTPGLRVMNIGHGMGIVDTFLQSHGPSEHHIVEAHPEVVAEMKRKGWDQKPGVRIHEGRWQDVLPALVGEGVVVDAIYYDTFAESYSDFREFFSEQVIGILEQDGEQGSGRWGFFNGMGADRQISYDVYQKVVEMDLFEAGFDVEWEELEVPALEGEWEGVRRPYWRIEKYRLPICKFMD
ncbi:arginine N-methyltransferase 2 [Aspergillus eucalypticola CBS 122712]|uniref:Arginine N-methyltransferase 2 n=1 Tax=Aspergillus eucalypticola (strain CBS 122712 / IBT 29274) TaxID=1448314 RepID=A0A317VNT3_ASPEC|nr:arginine N-methyltransferase 2 [Aspergillus eucalypticola CBS 122712]PWY75585.1 arginine N-methyltransferase 2 [Aspergillus eucalypticola CBS 122712]